MGVFTNPTFMLIKYDGLDKNLSNKVSLTQEGMFQRLCVSASTLLGRRQDLIILDLLIDHSLRPSNF